MTIRFTPEADAELAEARQWYAHQREDLDLEFMDCIDHALSRIVRNPQMYPSSIELSGARLSVAFPSPSFMESPGMRFRSSLFSIHVAILKGGNPEWNSTD
jgi:plasmid stabilization system protein ParE